jgi:hypothetical protein
MFTTIFKPIIMSNQERLRQFKIANPDWKYLTPERLTERWEKFCKTYNDGVCRLYGISTVEK